MDTTGAFTRYISGGNMERVQVCYLRGLEDGVCQRYTTKTTSLGGGRRGGHDLACVTGNMYGQVGRRYVGGDNGTPNGCRLGQVVTLGTRRMRVARAGGRYLGCHGQGGRRSPSRVFLVQLCKDARLFFVLGVNVCSYSRGGDASPGNGHTMGQYRYKTMVVGAMCFVYFGLCKTDGGFTGLVYVFTRGVGGYIGFVTITRDICFFTRVVGLVFGIFGR